MHWAVELERSKHVIQSLCLDDQRTLALVLGQHVTQDMTTDDSEGVEK